MSDPTLSTDVHPPIAPDVWSPQATPPPGMRPGTPTPPPGRGAVVAVVVGALATDLAMWTTGPGLAWTLGAVAVAIALAIGTRPTNRASYVLLAAVPVLAVWSSLRTSTWLLVPNMVAINLCLLLAASLAHRGRWFDQSLPRMVFRLVTYVESALVSPGWFGVGVASAARGRRPGDRPTNWRSIVVGAIVAAPIVVTLVVLLSSADAVFASFFDVGIDGSVVIRHAAFAIGGGWAMTALLHRAASRSDPAPGPVGSIPAASANVVLAAVAAVFGLYAASRLLALTGMAERIATTRGLTWAEYARSGFFQLLAVAAITAVVLLVVRGWSAGGTAGQRRLGRALALGIVVLVLGVVVDAIARLSGYEDAYGATMLRLYSTSFALWLAVVFVIIGVAFLRSGDGPAGRRWLAPAIVTSGLAALMLMNVVNPEAVVANRNLGQPTGLGDVDLTYLQLALGDDAVPAIVDHLDELTPAQRAELVIEMCAAERAGGGFLNPNMARSEAGRALADVCPA